MITAVEGWAGDPALAFELVAFRGAGIVNRIWSRSDFHGAVTRAAGAVAAASAPGDRVIIALPPGPAFLAALLGAIGAGRIAVPAQAPATQRARDHVARLRTWTDAPLVLSTEDDIAGPPVRLRTPNLSATAYLQFTSGSTGAPRGACVSFRALAANLAAIGRAWRLGPADRGVFWLPPHHDMGLVGALLAPVAHGFPATLMHPAAFAQRPARWLQLISARRATFSGGPNFAYDLCTHRIDADARTDLDLSSWRVAVNGAEPVRADTIARFAATLGPHGFADDAMKPGYGLAESVLFVAACDADERVRIEGGRVSCGRAATGAALCIVDEATRRPLPDGATGAIWVRGPSLADRYWNAPEASAETFGARLEGDETPWLRTGDLGWLRDGHVFVSGRAKDIVIRAGRKIHLADIDHALTARVGARVAALRVEDGERLLILHECAGADAAARIGDVLGATFDVVADQIALAPPGVLQVTTSGKIARAATLSAWRALPAQAAA